MYWIILIFTWLWTASCSAAVVQYPLNRPVLQTLETTLVQNQTLPNLQMHVEGKFVLIAELTLLAKEKRPEALQVVLKKIKSESRINDEASSWDSSAPSMTPDFVQLLPMLDKPLRVNLANGFQKKAFIEQLQEQFKEFPRGLELLPLNGWATALENMLHFLNPSTEKESSLCYTLSLGAPDPQAQQVNGSLNFGEQAASFAFNDQFTLSDFNPKGQEEAWLSGKTKERIATAWPYQNGLAFSSMEEVHFEGQIALKKRALPVIMHATCKVSVTP